MRIILLDENGNLALDIETKSDGGFQGIVKDGYDLYVDGVLYDNLKPKS